MQIKILDQVHLSSVRATTLAAGEVVEVSRDFGAELLKKHPDKFEAVADAANQPGDAPAAKAEAPPQNKVETAPSNKAGKRPRGKRNKG